MPAKNKALSIYPEPTARMIVGGNAPACNVAIACWARVIQSADLSALVRKDWNFLAEVIQDAGDDAPSYNASRLVHECGDAMTLNGTDWKWYGTEAEELATSLAHIQGKPTTMHPRGKDLLDKLAGLDFVQVQAVLASISFFWSNHGQKIDVNKDEWWTLPFRVRMLNQG